MSANTVAPIKPTIPFDLLDKLDIRVGIIELVSDVPKTRPVRFSKPDRSERKRIVIRG
jgi:hypothetical protein